MQNGLKAPEAFRSLARALVSQRACDLIVTSWLTGYELGWMQLDPVQGLSREGKVQVVAFAAQLLQLTILGVRCVAQRFLVQVKEELPRPAVAHYPVSNNPMA